MDPQSKFWQNWWDEQAKQTGSDYSLNRGTNLRLEKLEKASLRQFIEAVDPKTTDAVLDAGCGSGRNISVLSPLVGQMVGMDYSENMVRRAGERVVQEQLKNVKLLQGDITRLDFPTSSFDKVICASVLQYVDSSDCAMALGELTRVCKPGGRVILHLKNGASLYGLSLAVLRPIARIFGKRMKPEYYRTRAWHESELARHGGKALDYDGFGILTFVPLPARIVEWLLRLEMGINMPKWSRKFAVNYKLTVLVTKH